ncbi:sensor histidine kinase [Plantactinospora siamensis]|uniref:Signal transduction histidine-protein kinase/phosphatase MprB n=1 Tax=Plantactinospora siamensis TaxID=555372 RepID=A0ABV6NZN1_9ACTN
MRRRLTLLVAATTCLVLVAFLVPLATLLRSVARDRALASATAEAQGLVSLVGTAERPSLRLSVEQATATSGRPITLYLGDGSVLGSPAARSDAVELAGRDGRSLTVARPGGHEIVIAVRGRPEGTAVIRTFVTRAELGRGVGRAWLVLIALGAALVVLGVAVADRLARTLVAPITELSVVSHRLASADLAARARAQGPPELREVANALNLLAGRIQELLQDERERVADLSHRLRTPLTSVRLEAEALTDPAEADRVAMRVDDLERAVSGLIRQARWRTEATGAGRCDATETVRDRVAYWSALAADTGRRVEVALPAEPQPVRVGADELGAAVDALLGNIFAHTPDGTAFAVRLAGGPGGTTRLEVTDEGPGLPGDAVADALPRGVSRAGSTGLGLDIARRAAQRSGGRLGLGAGPAGGARIVLEFGPLPPAGGS